MEGVARENDLNQAVEVRKADAFEAVFADQEFADEFGNRRPALTSSVIDDVELHFLFGLPISAELQLQTANSDSPENIYIKHRHQG